MSIHLSNDISIHLSIQSINIYVKKLSMDQYPMDQWINGSMDQWINESMNQWLNGSMDQDIKKS